MNETQNPTNTIFDITLPTPPVHDNTMLVSIVVLCIATVIIYFIFRWKQHATRRLCRRQMRQLYKFTEAKTIPIQSCVYEMSTILHHALGVYRLSRSTVLPQAIAAYHNRWLDFIETFDQARYTSKQCSPEEIKKLFNDAEFWIKRWPTT